MMLSLLATLAIAAPGVPAQGPPKLSVHAVRFYAPGGGQTNVLALLLVPHALTEAGGNRIAWETTVQVRDKDGVQLYQESWFSGAPATLRLPEAYSLEPLVFPPMIAGDYAIVVTVKDSVSGRSATVETTVAGFDSPPLVSDLLLASVMRVTEPGDTVTAPGEVARGNLRFQSTPELTLDALHPQLTFMMEGYTATEATANIKLEVRDQSAAMVVSLPAFTQILPTGGGVIRGGFPLDGLPEGRYHLHAAVTLDGKTAERSAEFGIGSLEAAMARDLAMRNAGRAIDEVYFANMNEDELDRAAEVLELLASSRELSVYRATGDGRLSVAAKRRFLTEFWQKRDSNPASEANEERIRFYDAIEMANKEFAEAGRGARPGWKTDMGRIWVRYGIPDERQRWRQQGKAPPVEIWRYTQGRARFYIFAARTNFGLYSLLRSNDLDEPGQPGWAEIVTPEFITREIEPWLGMTFCAFSGQDQQTLTLTCN